MNDTEFLRASFYRINSIMSELKLCFYVICSSHFFAFLLEYGRAPRPGPRWRRFFAFNAVDIPKRMCRAQRVREHGQCSLRMARISDATRMHVRKIDTGALFVTVRVAVLSSSSTTCVPRWRDCLSPLTCDTYLQCPPRSVTGRDTFVTCHGACSGTDEHDFCS